MQALSLLHLSLGGTVDTQRGNTTLAKNETSSAHQGSLLRQPNLPTAAPVIPLGSLDVPQRSPSPSRSLKSHPRQPHDKKPGSLTTSRLEDEPGITTAGRLHPAPAAVRPPPAETRTMNRPRAAQAQPFLGDSARVRSRVSPGTRQLAAAWPFAFARVRERTAVLSARSGNAIKPARRDSERSGAKLPAEVYLQSPHCLRTPEEEA